MRRDLRRSIQKSMGRYLAILAIIALGAGFLAGLRCTKSAMMATAQNYIDQQALFDFRVLNTYGYTQADVDALAQTPGLRAAEGSVGMDLLLHTQDSQEEDRVYHVMSLPEAISVPALQAGRMPQRAGECLADGYFFSQSDLGRTITVSRANEEDTLEQLAVEEFTIVGLCSSPVYMNFERGSTTLGKGTVSAYLYVPMSTFDMDGVFTEIDLKLEQDYTMYAPEYDQVLADMTELLEPQAQLLADSRYETVKLEAQQALTDGEAEYEDGLTQYETEKADAEAQLMEAKQELDEGWAQLEAKEQELEAGQKALDLAQAQLDAGEKQLKAGEIQLQEQKAAAYEQLAATQVQLSQQYREASQGLQQIDDGIGQIDDGLAQIDDGLSQIESGLQQLELLMRITQTSLDATRQLLEVVERGLANSPDDQSLLEAKAALEAQIAQLESTLGEQQSQKAEVLATQEELTRQRESLAAQKTELDAQRAAVADGVRQLEDGLQQLADSRTQLSDQFAAAEATLEASRLELEDGQSQLDEQSALLKDGRAQLEAGRQELEAGQAEYDEKKAEADAEFAKAEQELAEAREKLDDGAAKLRDMEPAQSYVLDRNTNVAYVCFESDSNIVAGVSRVFPLFFFLVAALVCITTMSKMVDEERTQIGVMKALGYGSGAITTKYLLYSGSASLIGCLVGVALGTIVFPGVIWQGYRIMYNFSDTVLLAVDWPLCILIVVSFTLCMLAVTWLCCRKELMEVPAELIRPKAPKAGKRLLLERLPFWQHLSFLYKVSIRNTFRYRKRLVMMLVGVGGCAALVVTGFGIRDSISDMADYQYANVTIYDMSVSFSEDQSEEDQETFRSACAGLADGVCFLHESSADLTAGGKTKSVHFLAVPGTLDGFIDLHRNRSAVAFPSQGQAVISKGLAEVLDLSVGDALTLRTTQMDTLELTVSGIFDNNVYHYVIVSQETVRQQLGQGAEINTAYLNVLEGLEVHEAATTVSQQRDVLNVQVSRDLADRVGNMMASLDYIVALVVICAAALAFIVMYNLTNINITERVREIATIKVLGFYPMESASYVFREGMALTAMGCAVGLVAGKFLHAFVLSQIRIDMVYFDARVSWVSYLLAVVLTFLFACIVDFFLYFKLEHINMAEALKSVE